MVISYLNSLSDFLTYDFLTYALIGTIALSIAAGILSPIIVAKKYAFMGAAVSHSTLFGLALSFALIQGNDLLHFLITLAITLIMILFLSYSTYRQKLPSDSLIGIFFTVTMALGIIVYTLFTPEEGDLLGFLFGNILLLSKTDIYALVIITILLAIVIFVYFKSWIYYIYDEPGAKLKGINTQLFHHGLFVLLTVLIVTSIKLAGTVLVNTLLLIPGILALKMVQGLKRIFFVSIIFSLSTSLIGLSLANWKNLPSGATLSLTQFLFLVLALLIFKVASLFKRNDEQNE